MTGDTPNSLDVLREFGRAYCRDAAYPECLPFHAALARVEALATKVEWLLGNAVIEGDEVRMYLPDYQEAEAALVPFAAHKDTNHA